MSPCIPLHYDRKGQNLRVAGYPVEDTGCPGIVRLWVCTEGSNNPGSYDPVPERHYGVVFGSLRIDEGG